MLSDVLAAVTSARGLERTLVVSPDSAALRLAARLGAEPMVERGRPGYRSAARQAAGEAAAAGAAGLLVIPADLPWLTAVDVEALLSQSGEASVTLAPANDGGGTNALLSRPPGAIPFLYGHDSFRAHLRVAEERCLGIAIVERVGLGLDVDEAEDLRRLLERERPGDLTATRQCISEIDLRTRLACRGTS